MEFNPRSINVDVTNPADAAKKLPEVRDAAREARVFADQANSYANALAAMVDYLETLRESTVDVAVVVGDAHADAVIYAPNGEVTAVEVKANDRPVTSETAILGIIENAAGPITIGDVRERHPEIAYDTLRGKFKDLAKDGTIHRVKRGLYISARHVPEQVSLSENLGGSEE